MCLRSGSALIAPVVNRQASRERPFLFLCGKLTGRPLRRPALESDQFLRLRASPSRVVTSDAFGWLLGIVARTGLESSATAHDPRPQGTRGSRWWRLCLVENVGHQAQGRGSGREEGRVAAVLGV